VVGKCLKVNSYKSYNYFSRKNAKEFWFFFTGSFGVASFN